MDLLGVTGSAGFVLALAITQMPTERSTVICNLACNVAYVWHFALIGASGGLASQSVGVLNGVLKLYDHVPAIKRVHAKLWLTLPPLAFATVKKPVDVLPLLATAIKFAAFRMPSLLLMRFVQLAALAPWVPYCYIIESRSGLMNVALAVVLSCVSIFRYHGDEMRAALGRPRGAAARSKRAGASTEGARRSPRLAQRRREKTE
jgi:hypothetical protein